MQLYMLLPPNSKSSINSQFSIFHSQLLSNSQLFFPLEVLMIAVKIRIISLMSSLRGVEGLRYSAPMSNLIQYSVSLASFRAIESLCTKSAFDWASVASLTLAPIEVPDLSICLERTYSFLFEDNSLYKEIILRAKLKVLSAIKFSFAI